MNVLIVDDEETNIKLIGFYVKTYFADAKTHDYTVDHAANGLEALGYCAMKSYDVMFLDVKMPKLDGIKLLNVFKSNRAIQKPFVCMVTALGEDKYKHLFKLLGSNSLIVKPFTKAKVYEVLAKFYIPSLLQPNKDAAVESLAVDDFFDFDDLGDENTQEEKNHPYIKVSATHFLAEYANIDYMLEDLDDINEVLQDLIDQLDIANFEKHKEDIELALVKYGRFLNSLLSFSELSNALYILNRHVLNIQIEHYDELKSSYLIELIRSILEDISAWKDNVFIKKNVTDVYYINASILSNCKQLGTLIENR